jgi:pyruvate dehydrogenase E1 component beta subunit
MPSMTIREAVSQALWEEMERDPNVFIMGEEVGMWGGTYAVTKGFYDHFGPERVRDTPISEGVIVGAAVGAAMNGLKPVAEIMTINFAFLALDQIVNHAAKVRSMFGGQFKSPVVVRTTSGGGKQLGATHSQERGEVPDDKDFTVPIGKSDIKRRGSDVTLVTYSKMVQTSMRAVKQLEGEGIDVEVIDLRSLRPLDLDPVYESFQRTNRAVIVEEGWRSYGVGAEVAARIQENCFDYFDAPIERVAQKEVPLPYSGELEKLAIPQVPDVVKAVKKVMYLE